MQPSDKLGYRWAAGFSVDPREVETEFDAEAAGYEQRLQGWGYRVPMDSMQLLQSHVPVSSKVLEAGCGTGLVGDLQYSAGYRELYGCDLSSGMLEIAKSKGIYKQLLQADLCQRLPYDNDAFDATVCLGTLSFVEDAEPAFREFYRITRGGGVIMFSHRQDLFESRDCLGLCQRLEQEGLWQKELHSLWRDYLPGHPAYTDKLKVGYFLYRITKPEPCVAS